MPNDRTARASFTPSPAPTPVAYPSPAAVAAEPLKYGLQFTELLIKLLLSAGYSSRVTDPLIEWVLENTPAADLDATSARLGIVLEETA